MLFLLVSERMPQVRPPRIVRVGLIQNKIVLPTTAPVLDQVRFRAAGEPSLLTDYTRLARCTSASTT